VKYNPGIYCPLSQVIWSFYAIYPRFLPWISKADATWGNKTKLLDFIERAIMEHLPQVGITGKPASVVDIFAGTGSVASRFNGPETRVLANDLLPSNQVCLNAWLGPQDVREDKVREAAIVLVAGTAYAPDAVQTDGGVPGG